MSLKSDIRDLEGWLHYHQQMLLVDLRAVKAARGKISELEQKIRKLKRIEDNPVMRKQYASRKAKGTSKFRGT